MTEETHKLIEDATQLLLNGVGAFDLGTKQSGDADAASNAIKMAELLIAADKNIDDYYDKVERREIERLKAKEMAEIERNKQKITWGRAALELAKVIAPVIVSMIGYNEFQKRLLKFEETGRVTSTAGRDLHLPKFMK